MRIVGTALTAWAAIVAVNWSCMLPVVAATKTEPARAAAKLVDETLQREAREGVDDRAALLKLALEQVPPYEEAYWQSGFLFDVKRKKWLSLDEVQQQAAKDTQLTAYLAIRPKYAETEGGQTELARWCTKHKLDDQARAHWSQVLIFAPDLYEARRQLGFQLVNGKWLSQQDIADKKAEINSLQAAIRRWAPKLDDLLKRVAGPNQHASEQARQEMEAIKDPDVAFAIEAVLCAKGGEIALLGFELLKSIQSPQAAEELSWHAVFSPWETEGRAAATALRNQEKYYYVPLLLDAAETPAGPQCAGSGSAGSAGSAANPDQPRMQMVYRLDRGTSTTSWNTVEHLKEHPDWRTIPQMRFDPKSPNPVAKNTTNTVKKDGSTGTIQKREYYTIKNDRVQDLHTENKLTTNWQKLTPLGYVPVNNSKAAPSPQQQTGATPYGSDAAQKSAPLRALAEATGEHGPSTLPEWWKWWYDYNEVYVPSGVAKNFLDASDSKATANVETQSQRGDCLAGETLVCTETGPIAAEKVAVGDRIFCCDPETGRLTLKPVLRRTVRPEGRLVKIRAGGEAFEAGGGHVFWVAGKGWVKARDLREGMQLHTLRGTVRVEGIEPGAPQKTYGLAVADFHTFFVGKAMLLTHDTTIRPPTDRIVPGLTIPMPTKSAAKPKNAA